VTTKLDLVHVGRTLGYTLWDDGVFSLDRRKEIVSEVIDEVFHLKNSVAKHRPAEEFAAIRSRIARTRERLEKTAWQLEQFGSAKAAGYLRRWLPSIVTFAEHAVEGSRFRGPRTVERLMGEVSKRCKNQWMRWTAEGLEAILQLRLVKYADPEYYQAFLDELLQRSTKTAINCDLSIESTSGKVLTALQHDQNMCPTPLEIAAEGRINRPPVTDDRSREVLAEDFRGASSHDSL